MYSELNPKINYNNALPNTYDGACNHGETPAFSIHQNKYGDVDGRTSDYYCGGGSTAALRSMQMENTPVSLLFFSDENTARIQKMIKKRVFNESNGKFRLDVDQDSNDLLIAMRAVFFDESKNIDIYVVKQVKILNEKAVDYIFNDCSLMSSIKQYYGYLKEINNHRNIMKLPLNVNHTLKGSLPSITSLWK